MCSLTLIHIHIIFPNCNLILKIICNKCYKKCSKFLHWLTFNWIKRDIFKRYFQDVQIMQHNTAYHNQSSDILNHCSIFWIGGKKERKMRRSRCSSSSGGGSGSSSSRRRRRKWRNLPWGAGCSLQCLHISRIWACYLQHFQHQRFLRRLWGSQEEWKSGRGRWTWVWTNGEPSWSIHCLQSCSMTLLRA